MAGGGRPRVAALEWLDPLYVGGHWVPQMIELAGGEDVLGLPGDKSRTADWAELEAVAPEVVVSMPCGYDTERAASETLAASGRLAGLGRAGGGRGRLRLLLPAGPAAGGRHRAAGAPAAPWFGARAAGRAVQLG